MNDPENITLLSDFFSQYLSENRLQMIEQVLNQRTRYVTMVLEDIYQSQNGSAVVRTCECMGLQDVHVIEDTSRYSVNKRVLKGADKWTDIIRYNAKSKNNAALCFDELRRKGYKIYVTDPAGGMAIDEIPIDQKMALVMGNELRGISSFSADQADEKVTIPMYGFTESMNISVSAAICLNTLIPKVRNSNFEWQLSDLEKAALRLSWYKKCLRKPELVEKEFWKRRVR